ncbi:hypothetical protein INR49_006640 [Caranx melampygus]|nr:hypothetical protein INR49_006640 [Caranx melampygus]
MVNPAPSLRLYVKLASLREVFVVQWEQFDSLAKSPKVPSPFRLRSTRREASRSATETRSAPDIYEYHRVEINITRISSFSAVEFTPLPTCLQLDSCELCLSANRTSGCTWCHVLQRCSDGMDRHRQEWLDYGCLERCEDRCFRVGQHRRDRRITAALVLLLALILVALYINYHPAVASPLYLIQRRKSYWPSWKFQKQQPGYTEVEGEAVRVGCSAAFLSAGVTLNKSTDVHLQ